MRPTDSRQRVGINARREGSKDQWAISVRIRIRAPVGRVPVHHSGQDFPFTSPVEFKLQLEDHGMVGVSVVRDLKQTAGPVESGW